MPLNVQASQAYFKGLRCAYTSRPITVRAVSRGEAPALFFSPDAFDPTAFQPTSEELFAMLGTRDGIRGAARNGAELVCPYTGEQMTIVHAPGLGFQAVGGFSPSTPVDDPVEFARRLLMRKGKVPAKAPKNIGTPAMSARVEKEPPAPAGGLRDHALETADRLTSEAKKLAKG